MGRRRKEKSQEENLHKNSRWCSPGAIYHCCFSLPSTAGTSADFSNLPQRKCQVLLVYDVKIYVISIYVTAHHSLFFSPKSQFSTASHMWPQFHASLAFHTLTISVSMPHLWMTGQCATEKLFSLPSIPKPKGKRILLHLCK